MSDYSGMLKTIRAEIGLSRSELAEVLQTSLVSVDRWERDAGAPSPAQTMQIQQLYGSIEGRKFGHHTIVDRNDLFLARGLSRQRTLFDSEITDIVLTTEPQPPILSRISSGIYFGGGSADTLNRLLDKHASSSPTVEMSPSSGMSAGKNTYTYDAHTYHTKVPPQGIAELIHHYLPTGQGLVLDPFAGSGMTGVAARFKGYDCILNELSPAACFIANRFTTYVKPERFEAGLRAVLEDTQNVRSALYTTKCRECKRKTEILYTVWSYNVVCNECGHEFLLWDHCRQYGKRVRDHKILTEFPCPACSSLLHKSRLKRTSVQPVLIGYHCCSAGRQETTHPLDKADFALISAINAAPPVCEGFFPVTEICDGVNLRQPAKHGFDRIDKFYTPRNLAALSHLWHAIHRIEDVEVAGHLAFTFTSLYQRVTRFSEFRFWGGSGNTARFNVPYISNEANIFLTFERKARTILDHLRSTAVHYQGECIVVRNSATQLTYLPDESVDLIFTDPPFGANINYSEMNILWESWLGEFTDNSKEVVINRVQGKDVTDYQSLMTAAMRECHRVLRPGHWMLLVFMNSSKDVWSALRSSIDDVGFTVQKIDIFDKQHGTFKQFASENTAGFDLVLHCLKPTTQEREEISHGLTAKEAIGQFLRQREGSLPVQMYLHVERNPETDLRKLYSEWLSGTLLSRTELVDFASFREIAQCILQDSNTVSLDHR